LSFHRMIDNSVTLYEWERMGPLRHVISGTWLCVKD